MSTTEADIAGLRRAFEDQAVLIAEWVAEFGFMPPDYMTETYQRLRSAHDNAVMAYAVGD